MTVFYAYPYVGPERIRAATKDAPVGQTISSAADLTRWLAENPDARREGATFIVDLRGRLRLAPRRSEHVACAGGEPVLTAGELTFGRDATIVGATTQSTGYCPDTDSFVALERALADAGLRGPRAFQPAVVFRRCPRCGELNLVKDDWFVCVFCEEALPRSWNVSPR